MSIQQEVEDHSKIAFRPLYPIFDECRRIDQGTGQLINVSWVARNIQKALNTGVNCDEIACAMVPAQELVKSMRPEEVDHYRTYAAQLSLYDCGEPLIALRKGRQGPEGFDPVTCELLNGKARAVRAEAEGIALPVIIISRTRGRFWGMPPLVRRLGIASNSPLLSKGKRGGRDQRKHRCRSGFATLPQRALITIDKTLLQSGKAIVSERIEAARSGKVYGRVAHPTACGLVLSNDGKIRDSALRMLTHRKLEQRGLINFFPEPTKPGPSTPRHQETCLLILFAKLLKLLSADQRHTADKWYDDLRLLRDWDGAAGLRMLMRELLWLPVDEASLECPHQKDIVAEKLREYASEARAALANAGASWHSPLSERLLLFGATRDPLSVTKPEERAALLRRHYLELVDWTLRALFRAKHWRIGCNSIERLDTHGHFHASDQDDPTSERRPAQRISHEALGSARFQALTDLNIEPLLILAMHARFNPFLIWHDMRWAVPLGHWTMAIADLDAGRPTHVAVWMAELYQEQRRRQFRHMNHFTDPATMIVHWLHTVCGEVSDCSRRMAHICELVIDGFPGRNGRLIEIKIDKDGLRRLDSEPLKHEEDWALQATLFA